MPHSPGVERTCEEEIEHATVVWLKYHVSGTTGDRPAENDRQADGQPKKGQVEDWAQDGQAEGGRMQAG